MAVVSSYLAI